MFFSGLRYPCDLMQFYSPFFCNKLHVFKGMERKKKDIFRLLSITK